MRAGSREAPRPRLRLMPWTVRVAEPLRAVGTSLRAFLMLTRHGHSDGCQMGVFAAYVKRSLRQASRHAAMQRLAVADGVVQKRVHLFGDLTATGRLVSASPRQVRLFYPGLGQTGPGFSGCGAGVSTRGQVGEL